MFKEFAVDPALLSTWEDFRYFTSEFGASNGRFISMFPTSWKKLVVAKAKENTELSEIDFLRITETLDNKIDDKTCISRSTYKYADERSWRKNSIESHRQTPFHAIVTTSTNGSGPLIDGRTLNPNSPPTLWKVRDSVSITGTNQEIIDNINLLLRTCNKLILIDPYFDPSTRKYVEIVRDYVKNFFSERIDQKEKQIDFHINNRDSNPDYGIVLKNKFSSYLPHGTTLNVIRWDQQYIHNRHIVTDLGGIHFGYAVARTQDQKPDQLSRIDDETCKDLEKYFYYATEQERDAAYSDLFVVTGT